MIVGGVDQFEKNWEVLELTAMIYQESLCPTDWHILLQIPVIMGSGSRFPPLLAMIKRVLDTVPSLRSVPCALKNSSCEASRRA